MKSRGDLDTTIVSSSRVRQAVGLALAVVLLTIGFFWTVTWHSPILLDDYDYVFDNPNVQQGLSAQTLGWAMTDTNSANWHPVTWLSHAMDWQFFGDSPSGHFTTNIILHAINSGLVLFVLFRLTASVWRSLVVALLFALHPMHVEAVAWLSQRKELLATLFGLIALWGYVDFIRRARISGYLILMTFFALSLMSKQSWIMLPVLLLLLDYWPLKRMKGASEILPHAQEDSDIIMPEKGEPREKWWVLRVPSIALVFEKFPLFLLAGAGTVIAYMAQSAGGAVRDFKDVGMLFRLQNAAVNYIEFLRKAVWPDNIAAFYPLPDAIPIWKSIGAVILLAGITWGLILWRKRAPWAIVGWAWFLVSMLPVIGIVQLSDQAMADRYSYMPYLGLFVAVAWFIPFTWAEQAKPRVALVAVSITIVMLLYARVTWNTLNEWSDTRTLYQAAADRTTDNHLAYAMLASQDIIEGNSESAVRNIQRALEIKPNSPRINHAAGRIYLAVGQHELAISHLNRTLESYPNMVTCHLDLSRAFEANQQVDMAIYHLERASELRPGNITITRNLILLYIRHNALAPAEKAARAALVHQPQSPEIHFLLGTILQYRGKTDHALEHFQDALKLDPDNQRIKDRINELKAGPATARP